MKNLNEFLKMRDWPRGKLIKLSYNTLLIFPEWEQFTKAFKTAFILVHGHLHCEHCNGVNLKWNVHHRAYRKKDGVLPWEYSFNECQLVCDDCHKKHHKKIKQEKPEQLNLHEYELREEAAKWKGIALSNFNLVHAAQKKYEKMQLLGLIYISNQAKRIKGLENQAERYKYLLDVSERIAKDWKKEIDYLEKYGRKQTHINYGIRIETITAWKSDPTFIYGAEIGEKLGRTIAANQNGRH